MPDSEAKTTKRLFIIGPMGSSGEILQNIIDIKTALDGVLASFIDTIWQVDIPQENYRSRITEGVFSAIDFSDLIIADISKRSPCVLYELAFAHALGIPTVLIDDQATYDAGQQPVFYLSEYRTIRLKSWSIQEIRQELYPVIELWRNRPIDFISNPLTDFYKVPLSDASAVAGIAAGYAENFLVPVMRAVFDRQGRFEQPDGIRHPVAIVVVVPDNLDNLDVFQANVRNRLALAFPNKLKNPKLIVSLDRTETRSVTYVGDQEGVVVDVPRTVFPLHRSKRVTRLVHKDERKEMERKLLAHFKTVLDVLSAEEKDISLDYLHITSLDRLVECIQQLVSPSSASPAPDPVP